MTAHGARIVPIGMVPVVMITYATHEKIVRQALEAAVTDGFLVEKPQVIRIERE